MPGLFKDMSNVTCANEVLAEFPAVLERSYDLVLDMETQEEFQTILLYVATLLTAIVKVVVEVRTGQEAIANYNSCAFSIEAGARSLSGPLIPFHRSDLA